MAVQQESRREAKSRMPQHPSGIHDPSASITAKQESSTLFDDALDDLYTYESNRGAMRDVVDKAGNTVGDYHITKEVMNTYRIDPNLPEKQRAMLVLEGIKKQLVNGTVLDEKLNKPPIPGFDFEMLTHSEKVATLTFLYNAGEYQPKFRKALGHLTRARASGDQRFVEDLRKTAAGFMDVYKDKESGPNYGLSKRRHAEKDTFLNGSKAVHPTKIKLSFKDAETSILAGREYGTETLGNYEAHITKGLM